MKKILLAISILLSACSDGGLTLDHEGADGGMAAIDTEAPCTEWGCVRVGEIGCTRVCISRVPRCNNDPWPCLDGSTD